MRYFNKLRYESAAIHVYNKIRNIQPSCNIDEGFDEAITSHMATIAYKEKMLQ